MKTKNVIGIAIIILSSVISSGCKTGLQAGCEDGFINLNNAGCVPDPSAEGVAPPSETPSPEGGSSLVSSETFTDPNVCLVPARANPASPAASCFETVAKKLPQDFDATAFVNFDSLNRLVINTGNKDSNKALEDFINRFKTSVSHALSPLYVGEIRNIGIGVDAITSPKGVQNPYSMVIEFKEDALDQKVLDLLTPEVISFFDLLTKTPDGKDDNLENTMEITLVSREGNELTLHMEKQNGEAQSDLTCKAEARFLTCVSLTPLVAEGDSFFEHALYKKSFVNDVEPNCPQMHVFIKPPHEVADPTANDANVPFDIEARINAFTDTEENLQLLQIKILGWTVENDVYKWVMRNTTDLNMDVADMIPSFIAWMTTSSKNTVNEQDYCGFLDTCAQMESPCLCDTSFIPLANQNCPAKALDISQCALPPK